MLHLFLTNFLFNKVLNKAAFHLMSLPTSHLLFKLVQSAASCYIIWHHSPFHNFFQLIRIDSFKVETIQLIRCHPNYSPAFSLHIRDSKDSALDNICHTHNRSSLMVYCNSLGFEGGIEASAVLFLNDIEVSFFKYHLS